METTHHTELRHGRGSDRTRLLEILDKHHYAMLVTKDVDGGPRARPMAILSVERPGRIWFASRVHAGKVDELAVDHAAGVTLQDDSTFVSMTGTAEVSRDPAKANELWSARLLPWFPRGVEDPELVLVRFEPREAELWHTGARDVVRYLFEVAKAAAKGEPIEEAKVEHVKLSMRW